MTAQGGINGGGRTRGKITAFGSVFVNGVEYDLAGATITVNGVPATESKLKIGQVVTVDGVVNGDLVTGQAATVAHQSDVRGAVTAVDGSTATLRVLGQVIRVDGGTTFSGAFTPLNLAGIQVGNIVEVSGYRASGNALVATRVQSSTTSRDRIVGTVSQLNESTLTFSIGALRVNYSRASSIEGELANGAVVEVEGPRASGSTLFASKLDVEDTGLGGEAGEGGSIEGIVTSPLDAGSFAINGQVVIVRTTTVFEDGSRADLVLNQRVEAEGRFDAAGRIVAEKVKIEHEDDAYVFAKIQSIDTATKSVALVGLRVYIDVGTELDDHSNARDPKLTFGDLHVGDTIEIDGYEARQAKRVVAEKLVREDPQNRTRIGGRVSSVQSGRFVVLDLTIATSPSTVYRDQLDRAITAAKFYATAANREVKVRGNWNGTQFAAQEVEFEH
jgi:hypothetical protein